MWYWRWWNRLLRTSKSLSQQFVVILDDSRWFVNVFFFKQLSNNTFMSNIRAWYVVICKLPRYCLSMSYPGWWNWLLRTQKSLVPRIKWPLFVINIVEMGLNDQDTDCMWHWKLWNWLLRTQKSLVTWIKWPLFVLNIIEMGLNDEDTDCM